MDHQVDLRQAVGRPLVVILIVSAAIALPFFLFSAPSAAIVFAQPTSVVGSTPTLQLSTTPYPTDIPSPTPTLTISQHLDQIDTKLAQLELATKTSDAKSPLDTLQSLTTIVAVIVGGLWSYGLYRQYRQSTPRADMHLEISHYDLGSGSRLLHVRVRISNLGNVAIIGDKLGIDVREVLSKDSASNKVIGLKNPIQPPAIVSRFPYKWDWKGSGITEMFQIQAGELEIDSKETQVLHYDLLIPDRLLIIQVNVYLNDITKKNAGPLVRFQQFFQHHSMPIYRLAIRLIGPWKQLDHYLKEALKNQQGRDMGWNAVAVYDFSTAKTLGRTQETDHEDDDVTN